MLFKPILISSTTNFRLWGTFFLKKKMFLEFLPKKHVVPDIPYPTNEIINFT